MVVRAGSLTGQLSDLAEKEDRIHHHAMLLLRELYQAARTPINVTDWFYYFSFDFMGEILFGRTFHLVETLNTTAEKHFAPDLMSKGMGMLRYFTPTPWLVHICLQLAPYVPIITQKVGYFALSHNPSELLDEHNASFELSHIWKDRR